MNFDEYMTYNYVSCLEQGQWSKRADLQRQKRCNVNDGYRPKIFPHVDDYIITSVPNLIGKVT